jgi:hypothetical protein
LFYIYIHSQFCALFLTLVRAMVAYFYALIFYFSIAAAASLPLTYDFLSLCLTTVTLLVLLLLATVGAADLTDFSDLLLSLFYGDGFLGELPVI